MQDKDLVKKDWLTPLDVENEYQISKSTLAKWRMKNKYLAFSKFGKFVKYNRKDVEDFFHKNIIVAEV